MSKVLISIPETLLADIDRAVARAGSNRSAFLQSAARAAVKRTLSAKTQEQRKRASGEGTRPAYSVRVGHGSGKGAAAGRLR